MELLCAYKQFSVQVGFQEVGFQEMGESTVEALENADKTKRAWACNGQTIVVHGSGTSTCLREKAWDVNCSRLVYETPAAR